ncbi:MAG: histidinol-phosphatase HisJ family protein [Lachnospiraceae bacterium]|nr:histidinol-phosphatase HisJ family protein [Lachnospiraceae bacterium]
MYYDCHLHSDFSSDSQTPVAEQIERAIALKIPQICLTDHHDLDMPEDLMPFLLDTETYFHTLGELQKTYQGKIRIRIGVELGLQPHLGPDYQTYVKKYPFDYIIASTHLIHRMDPYYPSYFEMYTEKEAHRIYFEEVIKNLSVFSDFDALGHLDYIVRYGPGKNSHYCWQDFDDQIDVILNFLLEHDIALECNTAGYKAELGHPNPTEGILMRYRELGGEKITLGSDAHFPEHVGFAFSSIGEVLKRCGFRYYTVYEERQPRFLPL